MTRSTSAAAAMASLGLLSLWLAANAREACAADPGAQQIVGAVTASKVASSRVSGHDELTKERNESSLDAVGAAEQEAENLLSRLELTGGTDGLIVLSDMTKQGSLFGEARYRLTKLLQIGGSLAYRYQSWDQTSDTAFQLLVGPTFNFGATYASIANAYFITPQVGVTTGQTKFGDAVVNANTQATFALHLGKRFRLSDGVSYAPSIGVVKEWSFSPSFVVQPIALSVFF